MNSDTKKPVSQIQVLLGPSDGFGLLIQILIIRVLHKLILDSRPEPNPYSHLDVP